ncbi:MAG TPA: hypothetical protein PKC67_02860 [Kiritimatiellia bacterium]|nr:hypothetical protein [Kiritimatiellia bacterium]HMP33268.1 hypothetical protein [Kiritimatiellia bacterium]
MTSQSSATESVTVRRGRVDSLTVYDVTESELQDLERGTPGNLYLNFAIFLLSIAVSFFVALFSTEIKSTRTFCVFVIVAVIGGVGGLVLLAIWKKSKETTSIIIDRIKKRVPKEDTKDLDAQQEDAVDKE